MNKYIVKNCPSIKWSDTDMEDWENLTDCKQYTCGVLCQDCNDCLIKQVIEKCKKEDYFVLKYPHSQHQEGVLNSTLANEILQLFEIEECEK